MILRRLADAIRTQNWFTVVLEVTIVVVGVYIGIFLGEVADQRVLREDVNRALGVLLVQLEEDLVNLDQIIDNQTRGQQVHQDAIDALTSTPVDIEVIPALTIELSRFHRTFFPNRSAYQSIRDSGYLAEIEDAGLQLLVTSLFERFYRRQDANAASHDRLVVQYQTEIRDVYWDRYGEKLINDNPVAIIRMRNGLRTLRGNKAYYLGILTDGVRPRLTKTIDALSIYLQP